LAQVHASSCSASWLGLLGVSEQVSHSNASMGGSCSNSASRDEDSGAEEGRARPAATQGPQCPRASPGEKPQSLGPDEGTKPSYIGRLSSKRLCRSDSAGSIGSAGSGIHALKILRRSNSSTSIVSAGSGILALQSVRHSNDCPSSPKQIPSYTTSRSGLNSQPKAPDVQQLDLSCSSLGLGGLQQVSEGALNSSETSRSSCICITFGRVSLTWDHSASWSALRFSAVGLSLATLLALLILGGSSATDRVAQCLATMAAAATGILGLFSKATNVPRSTPADHQPPNRLGRSSVPAADPVMNSQHPLLQNSTAPAAFQDTKRNLQLLEEPTSPTPISPKRGTNITRSASHNNLGSVLKQQRSLLDTVASQLEEAEKDLHRWDQINSDQEDLLRGFRKIVSRETGTEKGPPNISLCVVEKNEELSHEVEQHCRQLECACQTFTSISAARAGFNGLGDQSEDPARSDLLRGRPAGKDWRPWCLRRSGTGPLATQVRSIGDIPPVPVVLMSATWMIQFGELPLEWRSDEVFVALTSEADDLEELTGVLLGQSQASSEEEIRECLRNQHIGELLLHPFAPADIWSVVREALHMRLRDEYLLVTQIGSGGSGAVHKAKRLSDGVLFALKEVNVSRLGRKSREAIEREVELLRAMRWPTIVFLVDSWLTRTQVWYLLMPLLTGGDLAHRIQNATRNGAHEMLPVERVADWYVQALHGVCYLHWRGVLHTDLKPGNFLIAANGRMLQICDLGSAVLLPGLGPHPVRSSLVEGDLRTPLYAGPEALLRGVHQSATDVWAIGATFYEVLALETMFPRKSALTDLRLRIEGFDPDKVVTNLRTKIGSEHMQELVQDICQMLRVDPLDRPSVTSLSGRPQTLQHLRVVLLAARVFATPVVLDAHFAEFDQVLADGARAAMLEAPNELSQESSQLDTATEATSKPKQRQLRRSLSSVT